MVNFWVSPAYWFLMQLGMIIGFATAWPANVSLIRKGLREAMYRLMDAATAPCFLTAGPGAGSVPGE
ncbi:DUF4396 domain-containing protein [Arthrobacter sp. A5]|uniref:DUF4396 domain-containing protein n=1 Tax=Arthrobacter sp. A5 TaxID=576926 RepID=UPI003DA9C6A4